MIFKDKQMTGDKHSRVKLDPLVASVKICEKWKNKYMFSLSVIYIYGDLQVF